MGAGRGDMTPKVEDHELYYAWLETHATIDQVYRNFDAAGHRGRMVLGAPDRVHDAETGVVIAFVYRNPDLEAQESRRSFWRRVREDNPDGARRGGGPYGARCEDCRASACPGDCFEPRPECAECRGPGPA